MKNVTPAVRAAATRLGVDLDEVTGTGAGGRVTVGDVRAAVGAGPFRARAARTAASGPYGGTGALPAFCASGLDPHDLLAYPVPIRSAMAAAPTLAAAYALGQRYAGLSDADAADRMVLDPAIPSETYYAYLDAQPAGYVGPGGTAATHGGTAQDSSYGHGHREAANAAARQREQVEARHRAVQTSHARREGVAMLGHLSSAHD